MLVVVLTITLLTFAGCSSHGMDLAKTGYLSVAQPPAASLSHAPSVYEREGNLVVSGSLELREASHDGHIHVSVVGPDGSSVYVATVQIVCPSLGGYVGPRNQRRRLPYSAAWHARYSVEFPGLPPRGSVVNAVPHCDYHAEAGDG